MIRWTGLAPWECEFSFPGSLTSAFLGGGGPAGNAVAARIGAPGLFRVWGLGTLSLSHTHTHSLSHTHKHKNFGVLVLGVLARFFSREKGEIESSLGSRVWVLMLDFFRRGGAVRGFGEGERP